jgi:uncharacterized protein YdeI (YjbR/CyaY-like superfamily)
VVLAPLGEQLLRLVEDRSVEDRLVDGRGTTRPSAQSAPPRNCPGTVAPHAAREQAIRDGRGAAVPLRVRDRLSAVGLQRHAIRVRAGTQAKQVGNDERGRAGSRDALLSPASFDAHARWRIGVRSASLAAKDDLPVLAFATAAEFEDWLAASHATSAGLWLKIAKRGCGHPSLTYDEALDAALCWGWIDGQKRALDESWWLQKFTPRRAASPWSQRNRDKMAALTAAGRMRPPGLAEVERAKADGRWDAAYAGQRTATVPDDLAAALAANPAAAAFFDTLDRTNRYAVLYRVQEAKRPETRARRIEKFVAMLAAGEKLH